jgi:phosphopantothenoylcysteine synthetase/decarboxylase
MALDCPIVMAPAMNDRMYRNPILQRNIGLLEEQGVRFVEPATGELACGTRGQGRLADTETILQTVASFFKPPVLAGMTIWDGGAHGSRSTHEFINPLPARWAMPLLQPRGTGGRMLFWSWALLIIRRPTG